MANLRLEVILAAIDKATGPLKRITGGATGTAEALRKSKAALRDLQGNSADISAFARTRAALRATSTQLADHTAKAGAARSMLEAQRAAHHSLAGEVKAARVAFQHSAAAMASQKANSAEAVAAYQAQQQSLATLEARLNQSTGALRKQKDAVKTSETRVKQLTAKQADLSAKLDASRGKLEAAGLSTDKLAGRQRKLRGEMDKATAAIKRQELRAASLAKAHATAARLKDTGMSNFARGSSMALTGFGAARASLMPVGAAMQFESAMADVRKVVDGLDDKRAFKRMGSDIQALSMRVPMASEEIAKMVAFAGQSLGKDTAKRELLQFAEDAAKVGVAFDMTAEDAGQTMATWRTAFRLGRNDAVKLADQVNYLGNTGPANAQKITAIVNRIGALGEVAGLQSAPLAALGATIAGMGVDEEIAATGIKNLLLRLNAGSAATKRQREAFKALRLDAVQVAKGMQLDSSGTILTVLERIQQMPQHMQSAALTQLFGSESVGAIAPLLTNLKLVRENLNKVSDARRYGGSMEAEYASRAATSANTVELAKNSARALAQQLGDNLLPAVTDLATRASGLLARWTEWAKENPKLAGGLMKAAIVGALLFTILGGGIAIFGVLAMGLGQIIGLFTTLRGLSIGGRLVSGLVRLAQFGAVAKLRLLSLGRAAVTAGRLLLASPLGIAIGLLAVAGYMVWKNWDGMKAGAILLWQDISNAVSGALQWIAGRISAVWNGIKTYLAGAWAVITGLFSGDGAKVRAGLDAMWGVVNGALGGWPAKLLQIGRNLMQGLINGVNGMAGAVKDALAGIANGAVGKLKGLLGIRSPSRVFAALGGHTMAGFTQGLLGGQGGAQAALGRIGVGLRKAGAGLALGTLGAGTAMAANIDARPPLSAGARGAVAGGGNTYHIHINAPAGAQARDIAALVRAEIERLEHQRTARRRAALSDYE